MPSRGAAEEAADCGRGGRRAEAEAARREPLRRLTADDEPEAADAES